LVKQMSKFSVAQNFLGYRYLKPKHRRTIPFGDTALRGYAARSPALFYFATQKASPTDPKRRTRPHRPLRGRTFLEQAAFLTGSFGALRLRLSTMVPKWDSTATANGNICSFRYLYSKKFHQIMSKFYLVRGMMQSDPSTSWISKEIPL
jgi:hypothetical protein